MSKTFRKIKKQALHAKQKIKDFRLYDVVSQQINERTSKDDFQLFADLSYGTHERQIFDLYKSNVPRSDRALIVFVYGGTWSRGKKEDYLFVAETFAQEGFDVAILDYRLAPEFIFPTYVDDFVLALDYLYDEQKRLDICTDQLILMGHSAGAFNIMSAVYHPTTYSLKCRSQIKVIIGMAGPYHFDYLGKDYLERAFDTNVSYQKVMPYYFIEKNDINHVLILASKDFLVATSNTFDMNRMLLQKGNKSQVYRIPYTGHITLIGSLSSHVNHFFKTKDIIMNALTETLTPR